MIPLNLSDYEYYFILASIVVTISLLLFFSFKIFRNLKMNDEKKGKYQFHFIIRTQYYYNHHEEITSSEKIASIKFNEITYKTDVEHCFRHELGLLDKWLKGTDVIYYAIFDDERKEQIINHPVYSFSAELVKKVREYKGLKGLDKEFEKVSMAQEIPWWVYVIVLIVAVTIMILYLNQIGFFEKFLEALNEADKVKPR